MSDDFNCVEVSGDGDEGGGNDGDGGGGGDGGVGIDDDGRGDDEVKMTSKPAQSISASGVSTAGPSRA